MIFVFVLSLSYFVHRFFTKRANLLTRIDAEMQSGESHGSARNLEVLDVQSRQAEDRLYYQYSKGARIFDAVFTL